MKTLNMFYLVIYWTQKVHDDFNFHVYKVCYLQSVNNTLYKQNQKLFRKF